MMLPLRVLPPMRLRGLLSSFSRIDSAFRISSRISSCSCTGLAFASLAYVFVVFARYFDACAGEHYAYRLSPPLELALEGAARTMAAKTEANLFIFPPIQERL